MKKILVEISALLLCFLFAGCSSSSTEVNNISNEPTDTLQSLQASSETANQSNVKYEDVSSFIQNALNDMGVSEKPRDISIKSFETSGTISATVNFQIAGKQLSAGCFKDNENKNWYLVNISSGKGSSHKCYWLADNVKGEDDLYDFKTDKLISKKSE